MSSSGTATPARTSFFDLSEGFGAAGFGGVAGCFVVVFFGSAIGALGGGVNKAAVLIAAAPPPPIAAPFAG